jgi:hypothetical protein
MRKVLLILCLFLFSCKGDKNSYNDPIAILLGASPKYSPFISNLLPRRLAPEIRSSTGVYPPSQLVVTGRNFSLIPQENRVLFNDILGRVDYSTETELRLTPPPGITSGLLSVSRMGGECNSFDRKSGLNCAAIEYYVDCYSNYNNVFGEEVNLPLRELQKIEFESNGTKAFRADLPQGDYSINIACSAQVIVQRFTNSCVPIDEFRENSNLLINPQIPVQGGFTLQFFVSTTKGTCNIGVL